MNTTNDPLITGVSMGILDRATSWSLKCILEGYPTKKPAEFGNMDRKYTRMQLGMEANKSVQHLDFIKKELPVSFNTIFFCLCYDTWCFSGDLDPLSLSEFLFVAPQ